MDGLMVRADKMSLTEQVIAAYRNDRYLIKNGMSNRELSSALLRTFIKILKKYSPEFSPALLECTAWDDPLLSEAVIAFRQEHRSLFGIFYDALQNSSILQALFTDSDLYSTAATLLDDDAYTVSSTGHMLRVDVPDDTRNTLDWHQDSAYYKQNQIGDHGCVVLLPLVDIGPDNGSLMILVGSHREGVLAHELRKDGRQCSEKFTIPERIIEKYRSVSIVVEKGALVFCQMNLIHRSGFNSSVGARFSAGIRFHKTLAADFLPGRLIYEPNKTAEQQLASAAANQ